MALVEHRKAPVGKRKQRRTQEERRAETRAKLLDATIQSLLEVGYGGTTTRRVAELAGVSQGAQTHHFPYRVELVAAAIERLAQRRAEELRRLAASLPDDRRERARRILDLLWRDFSSELFAVFVKVWVAAADDRELYDRLVPIERMMAREIVGGIPLVAGGHELPADLAARVTTVLATLRGLALTRAFEPTARRPKDPWPAVRPLLERMLLDD
jgi:AcrR family transcriptional regulator